jgi:hypothetical protein
MIAKLLAGLVSPVTNYLSKRNDNKTAVIKQKVQRVMNADDKEAELALILADGMKYSWKDEYWTVVLSIPAIACFFPKAAPHIEEGFTVLATMPEFYQYWLGICVLTAFGLRLKK